MKKLLLVLFLFVAIGFSSVAAQAAGPITEWEWIEAPSGTNIYRKIPGIYNNRIDAGAAYSRWSGIVNLKWPHGKTSFYKNTDYWSMCLSIYPNSPPYYYPGWAYLHFIWPKDGIPPALLEEIYDPALVADNS